MAIKPITFDSKMVRAILDGRKTVTRRVVEGAENYSDSMHGSEIYVADGWFVAAKQNGTVKWVRSP